MINILKLTDARTNLNNNCNNSSTSKNVKYQNAFNQTPIHLLLDPQITSSMHQFKQDSKYSKHVSINTNTDQHHDLNKLKVDKENNP